VEVWVQQLFKAIAAAPDTRVMQLNLQSFEDGKECAHRRRGLRADSSLKCNAGDVIDFEL
jgi:hypothetical protein